MNSFRVLNLICVMSLSIGLWAQPNIDSLLEYVIVEPGKSYVSVNLKSDNSKQFYLLISAPIYEVYYDTIKVAKEEWLNKRIDLSTMTETHEIKPASLYWRVRTEKDSLAKKCIDEITKQELDFVIVDLRTNQSIYETYIAFETFTKEEDLLYNKLKVVEKFKSVNDGEIILLQTKKEILPNQTIIEIEGGDWRPFWETLCPEYSLINKIITIQRALKEKGYDCKVTGVIDSETRAALIQFQKENSTPHRIHPHQLLKKLGIDSYDNQNN